MYLVITESPEEFSRLKLTLGRGLKHVQDRRELSDVLNRDTENNVNLVIVGSSFELTNALSLSEELRVTHPTIGVILLRKKLDANSTTQALSAGIRDVVQFADPEAIVVACKRSEDISRRQLRSTGQRSESTNLGRVIVIHGARDGLGATTVAINLATDLVLRKGLKVCLVDSLATMGDVAVRFRVESTKSWLDLIGIIDIDEEALHTTIHIANSGVHLLLSPREINPVAIDENAFINQIIKGLQSRYDFIIIDTDSRGNALNRGLFGVANRIILISDLDLASLKNLKIRLKEIGSSEIKEDVISLYINKSDLKVGINPSDIPELIGMEVSTFLPWDNDVTRIANEGLAIVTDKERSGLSHAVHHATDSLIDDVRSTETQKSKSRTRKSA